MKVINQEFGERWALYHGDCVEVIKGIPDNSIHFSIFSPPFPSVFTYSDSERDMGNSIENNDFIDHFGFLNNGLYRVIMPGRLVAVHCMNILATITKDGHIGVKDFRGDIIRAMCNAGFIYHSEVLIWKDPLLQAVRTKALGLAHKQIVKDSAMCNQGLPDFIEVFRKPGANPEPVAHPNGFTRYVGKDAEPKAEKQSNQRVNKYSHQVWQKYASPVWFDINQSDTLNVQGARENRDERHICPLQLQTIERCLELWTNPGDTVLSPFAGIGSEGYQAIQQGRNFIGIELKESYWRTAVKNMKLLDNKPEQLELAFD